VALFYILDDGGACEENRISDDPRGPLMAQDRKRFEGQEVSAGSRVSLALPLPHAAASDRILFPPPEPAQRNLHIVVVEVNK
jgi:hypothetical protein